MKYYTDGFQIGGNPSKVGGGYTIVDETNQLIERKVIKRYGFTNNEAEILGVWEAMKLAEKGDSVSTDSMVCLTWVNKGKSKARPDLNPILEECLKLRDEKEINFLWEGRAFNLAGVYNENNQEDKYEIEEPDLSWIK